MTTEREPTWEQIADGLALWEEHKPQSGEDWVAVAERCLAAGELGLDGSPLFRALMIQTERLAAVSRSGEEQA